MHGLYDHYELPFPKWNKPSEAMLNWSMKGIIAPNRLLLDWHPEEGISLWLQYDGKKIEPPIPPSLFKSLNRKVKQQNLHFADVGLYDFDKDGIEELVMAFCVPADEKDLYFTQVLVMAYKPPVIHSHVAEENWKVIFNQWTEGTVHVKDQSIFFSNIDPNFEVEYRWIGEKFINPKTATI